MKFLYSFITALILAIMPVTALAQLTVPQGGTGQTSFTADQILYGVSSLRLGSEAAFTYDPDTNTLTAGTAALTSLSVGNVSNTEIGYLDGVTSAIQTQLAGKQASLTADDITPDMLLSTGQTDEYCLSYEATGDTWEWKDCTGAAGDSVTINGSAITDPNFVSTGDIVFSTSTNDVIANINAGSIVNADVNASAAIVYSKLSLGTSILETDLSTDVTAVDGDFLQYDSTGTNFTWRSASEVLSDIGAEGDLANEAGLYAALSDVTQFWEAGDTINSGTLALDSLSFTGDISTTEIADDTITHADIADADQTSTLCIYIEDPTADDDLNSIWANKTANDFLITEIWGESDQTVSFDLQVDDGTPADVSGTDIAPAAGEAEDTTLTGDTTLAAGEELDLAVTSVTNTPTWVSICWTGNWID